MTPPLPCRASPHRWGDHKRRALPAKLTPYPAVAGNMSAATFVAWGNLRPGQSPHLWGRCPAGQRGAGLGTPLNIVALALHIPRTNSRHLPASPMTYPVNYPHPPHPCLKSPRFRRRSVSRDVRGQAGVGAFIKTVTCGDGGRGESHGASVARQALLSSLPRTAMSGSVEPSKWQGFPKGNREQSHAARRGDHL